MFKRLALTGALALSLSGPALAIGGPSPYHGAEQMSYQVAQATGNTPGNDMNTTDNTENRNGITGRTEDTRVIQNNGADADDIDNSAMVSFPWMLLAVLIAAGLGIWYFRIRKQDPLAR